MRIIVEQNAGDRKIFASIGVKIAPTAEQMHDISEAFDLALDGYIKKYEEGIHSDYCEVCQAALEEVCEKYGIIAENESDPIVGRLFA